MAMRWHETPSKLFAHGAVKHIVWKASASSGFYAKSGMDVHGPYETASRARKACADIEEAEAADHIDAQAATIKVLVEALDNLMDLNDNGGPFGGEIYHDRVNRAWDNARAALAAAKDADNE